MIRMRKIAHVTYEPPTSSSRRITVARLIRLRRVVSAIEVLRVGAARMRTRTKCWGHSAFRIARTATAPGGVNRAPLFFRGARRGSEPTLKPNQIFGSPAAAAIALDSAVSSGSSKTMSGSGSSAAYPSGHPSPTIIPPSK
jgi:hypothetical protein